MNILSKFPPSYPSTSCEGISVVKLIFPGTMERRRALPDAPATCAHAARRECSRLSRLTWALSFGAECTTVL